MMVITTGLGPRCVLDTCMGEAARPPVNLLSALTGSQQGPAPQAAVDDAPCKKSINQYCLLKTQGASPALSDSLFPCRPLHVSTGSRVPEV